MADNKALPQQLEAVLTSDDLVLEWQMTADIPSDQSLAIQQETFRHFHNDGVLWLFHLGFAPADIGLPESLEYWRGFAMRFARMLALTPDLEFLRHQAVVQSPDPEQLTELVDNAPLAEGVEHLSENRLVELWEKLNDTFRTMIRDYDGSVESFLHGLRPDLELAGRVFFHLVENKKGAHPFAFMATYSTHINEQGSTRHLPLKNAIREFGEQRDKLLELLSAVYRAARDSRLLNSLLESGKIFQPLAFDSRKAFNFLKEVPLYEASGIRCRIPNWWTNRRAGASLSLNIGGEAPSRIGLDAIISCFPGIEVGGQPITEDEARQLLEQSDGLVMIKNKWVEVDKDKLQKTLNVYEQARKMMAEGMTLREAMQLLLQPETRIGDVDTEVSVSFGEWLKDVVGKLREPSLIREMKPARDFKANLRPYQQAGLNWLNFLDSLGFGPCLADDMGLGKTIQVLAFLSVIRNKVKHPSLLVVPASLIGNWQSEIERFLPSLKVLIAHASTIGGKAREGFLREEIGRYDLVITTYGMIYRCEWLHESEWGYAILDEAQAIKNHDTRQSRAVKKLRSRNRLILTGTPVENRLGDLWSLFDFLNPGLLGNAKEFKQFVRDIHQRADGYGRLRRVISPYILRRLKTDREIITDLPDKVEMKTYAELTRRQVVLYRDLVKDVEAALEDSEGIQRKGLVLASLLKFKQICNHPDQYVGDGAFDAADSGKFMRLRDICETIMAKHERVLIFTQFREMVDPLNDFLADVFGHQGLVLHGGVSVRKRRERVDLFQTSRDYIPYMVLSVKAAGVGLNLTRANHVVHFDRWWNPAVENQATDRVFRIGQQKKVLVHKFVCNGTVEEKIDVMIENKTDVSEKVIAATGGEGWITEMSNSELADLFTLSL